MRLSKYIIEGFVTISYHIDVQVGELRANLAQMESMTMGKSQDLEEAMETCQAKVTFEHTCLYNVQLYIPEFPLTLTTPFPCSDGQT